MSRSHVWITGAGRAASAAAAQALAPDVMVDCHRRRCGPYTATGSLLRALLPRLAAQRPDLCSRHAIEILAVAPELEPLVGPVPGTLTSQAPQEERTRWYSHLRTRRIAHGVVDLLQECASARPLTLAFTSVDHGDHTDRELLSIALRRLDPAQVRLVACVRQPDQDQPDQDQPDQDGTLGQALRAYCRRIVVDDPDPDGAARRATTADLAAAFIASHGTSDVAAEIEAYRKMDPELRVRLHDEQAAELEEGGEWSYRLGAVPYHRGLGSAPGTVGRAAYWAAIEHCMGMAYYHAGLELVEQLAATIDPQAEPAEHYRAQTQRADFLALLLRAAETEPIYFDLLSRSVHPYRHMILSYTLAMLYTRIYDPQHKDHIRARAHVNTAVALAGLLPDPADRAFHSVFMNNGKALVELHLGNVEEALRLVSDGIDRLDRELPPDRHQLHRSVLRHNRSQVLAALGRHEEALAELDHVIGADPHYPEYRFDRANLRSLLGRHAEALGDYEVAARLGPPFPELFYNIGDLRAATGDRDGAIREFQRVLDLEPDHLDARVGLASLLLDAGDPVAAAAQARAGLAVTPDAARLHCTLGLALLDLAEHEPARQAFDRALQLDPELTEALVNRAVARYEEGCYDAAVADLTRALAADGDNPDIRYNRGVAYESAGRLAEAVADYTLALQHDRADRPALLLRRARCQAALDHRNGTEAKHDAAEAKHDAAGAKHNGAAAKHNGQPLARH